MAGSGLRNNLQLIWWDQWECRKGGDLHLLQTDTATFPPHPGPSRKAPITLINRRHSGFLSAALALYVSVEYYIMLSVGAGTKCVFFLQRILIKCCHLQRRDNYKDSRCHVVKAGTQDRRRRRDDCYYCIIGIRSVCSGSCSKTCRSGNKKEDYDLGAK